MNWDRRSVLFGLAAGLVPSLALGTDQAHEVRRAVLRRVHEDQLRAVVIGVWQGSTELLRMALGQSEDGQRASFAMHYRTGAITTAYLGALLLHLADRQKARLTDRLSNWMPHLPAADQVTLEMLSQNRSGYADFLATPPFQSGERRWLLRDWTAAELIKLGTGLPMVFKPGTSFHYSHTNAVILGEALIRATRTPIAKLLEDAFLRPHGLSNTYYPSGVGIREPVLHAFSREFGPYEDSTWWNPAWVSHSGAMISNLDDVARWARLLGSGTILSKSAYAKLIAPTNVGDGGTQPDLYNGMGVIVSNGWILQNALFFGWNPVMAYLPAKQITISLNSVRGPGPEHDKSFSLSILKDVIAILAPNHRIPDRYQ